jgi:hypothetical protein
MDRGPVNSPDSSGFGGYRALLGESSLFYFLNTLLECHTLVSGLMLSDPVCVSFD